MGHKNKKERSAIESLSSDDVHTETKQSSHDHIQECNESIKKCKTKKKKRKSNIDRVEEIDQIDFTEEEIMDVQCSEIKNGDSYMEQDPSLEEKEKSVKSKKAHKQKKERNKEISSDDVLRKQKKRTHDECKEACSDSTPEIVKTHKSKKKKRKSEYDTEDNVKEVAEGDGDDHSAQFTDDDKMKEEENSLHDTDSESEEKRKMKEKKRLKRLAKKAEAKAAKEQITGEVGQNKSLQYLHIWKHQRDQWSFQKVRQVWLLQHMYDVDKVSDDNFEILLEYMAGLKGKATEITLQKAEKLMDEYEKTEKDESVTETGPSQAQYDRARQIIQIIS